MGHIKILPSLGPNISPFNGPMPLPLPPAPSLQPAVGPSDSAGQGSAEFSSEDSLFTYTPLKRAINSALLLLLPFSSLSIRQSILIEA